jgi:hypothetical protein
MPEFHSSRETLHHAQLDFACSQDLRSQLRGSTVRRPQLKDKSDQERDVLRIAEVAGLQIAIDKYRDELIAAAKAAADARAACTPADDPAVEPWPPMRVEGIV